MTELRTTAYTTRPARSTDLDRLTELLLILQDHIEASNPDLWRMRPEARRQLKGQLAARLRAENSRVLVAEHTADGVIAAILGRILVNKRYTPTRTGSIDQIVVRVDHRRAGVGSLLVAELCRFFALESVDDLSLRYVVGNESAAGFWASLGLEPRIITAGVRRSQVQTQLAPEPKP